MLAAAVADTNFNQYFNSVSDNQPGEISLYRGPDERSLLVNASLLLLSVTLEPVAAPRRTISVRNSSLNLASSSASNFIICSRSVAFVVSMASLR
jgi:hypothetical protein